VTISYTPNKSLQVPSTGSTSWDVPLNADWGILDNSLGGLFTFSVTGFTTTQAMTNTQCQYAVLNFTGVLGANLTYTIPAPAAGTNAIAGGVWIVNNLTSGSYSLTIAPSSGGGSSVSVPAGQIRTIYSDGTNVNFADSTSASFPAGTAMVFAQTNAPVGWVKSVSYNDYALRVVNGTAGTGGSVPFSTAFSSQSVGGSVGGTSLSVDQIPAHTHTYVVPESSGGSPSVAGFYTTNYNGIDYVGTSGSTGTGLPHSHTFTGTTLNLAVNYVDVIIATKS